jgi:hypothetical protein
MDRGVIESIITILRSSTIESNYEEKDICSLKHKKQFDSVIMRCL